MPEKTVRESRKALFLDRDGVINADYGYVHTKEQCLFVEGIYSFLQTAHNRGYCVIVVTNQAGIGRGYYSEDQFHQFMSWLNEQLYHMIDAYYFCPFHAEHGLGTYKRDSFDRKPNPGMLLRALREHNINAVESVMVGDRKSDMIAAHRAGIGRAYLLSNDPLVAKNADSDQALYEVGSCLQTLEEVL